MERSSEREFMIQITSGRGPEECWRVVTKVLQVFLKEARAEGLDVKVVETVSGNLNRTLMSAMILINGNNVKPFLSRWVGTIQWKAQSPFRKFHKRKNWFIGVFATDVSETFTWNEKEVVLESLKASGPGGQHVNKTESAVRAKHLPSGISVLASERRSQHQNKAEALARLRLKLQEWEYEQALKKAKDQWQQHNTLERGNAIRVFNGNL